MNRKRQQAELLFKLGQLMGPMLSMVDNPSSYDSEDRTRILARYAAEVDRFAADFRQFTLSEPGHNYQVAFNQAIRAIGPFTNQVGMLNESDLFLHIRALQQEVFEAIQSIPVPIESAIYEAHTPFSTYCLVKDLCSASKKQVVWLDRYFDHTIFHRYLADIPKTVLVTLVTYPDSKLTSTKDRQRHTDFMDVSRLFAHERGSKAYRLVTDDQFHDRWLRCDDKLLALGGSIKDLEKDTTFTVSKLDATTDNIRLFEGPLANGAEVFGPTNTTHP